MAEMFEEYYKEYENTLNSYQNFRSSTVRKIILQYSAYKRQ